ncbi:MAG TPA: glycine cleavage T C-terminal barrel domain-containing protein [Tepidisphaeraceae bacterium]|jgi:aminomethyltransferase|nr:glycine cleavage T C-terminal barrel domain-containing protein [Tepidisphaeraceae bacterium]
MTDTPAPAPPLPNPLRARHEAVGAEFQAYASLEVVSTFGEPQAEYAAIRKASALIDEPQRGILELTGEDRLAFLNNLLTNQTWDKATKTGLAAGAGVYAFFLNGKGRIITDACVIERGDRTWLDMDARLVDSTRQAFDKFLFRERVKMTSRVGDLHTLALHGPGTSKILGEVCDPPPGELEQVGSFATRLFDVDVVLWRDDACGVSGFHMVAESAKVGKIWDGLLARFFENQEPGRRRLRPAGWAAFNATRIEAGRPIFGIDFDDTVLPAETGQLARAASFTKGCYLGQEIVARMHARGQVARQIVGLRVADDALPMAGALLYDDQNNQVGGITSSTVSPVLSNACICLGFAKKAFIPPGSIVKVPAEGAMRQATVVALPFLAAGASDHL